MRSSSIFDPCINNFIIFLEKLLKINKIPNKKINDTKIILLSKYKKNNNNIFVA